jgi:aspartate ammonia-lyase
LANIGLELGGYSKGDYHTLEPHDDLNNGQSTNDVYPTAIKVALLLQHDPLVRETEALVDALRSKGRSFKEILKMGRTEGQDAVPMTLGQEFNAFAAQLEDALSLLKGAEQGLLTVNMGATAIGTGITAAPGYAKKCAKHLARITGKDVVLAEDLIAATTSMQGFVHYSSALKNMAVVISKIASDLILLSTGPRAGLFEINLPAMQPGSSIMPGKVNPVMPELMNIVAFKVMGNDVTVGIASHAGQLQLNAYEPVIALSLLESQRLFTNGFSTFREKCINGITANEKVTKRYIETSVGVVTALNPVLGYEKTTELASEALSSGKGIIELVREKKLLSESEIQKLLDPASMTGQN